VRWTVRRIYQTFFIGCNADGGGGNYVIIIIIIINTLKEVNSLPLKTGFDPRPVTVGFVVDKVAQGQVSVRVFLFPCRHFHSLPSIGYSLRFEGAVKEAAKE
jgi:hypothetical protein